MFATVLLAAALAQPAADANALTVLRPQHRAIGDLIVAAAERIPEADYAFKPTPDVRSVGELLLHVAGVQYFGCSFVAGTKAATPALISKNAKMDSGPVAERPTKAQIIEAVRESFRFCQETLGQVTVETANRIVKVPFLSPLLGFSEAPAHALEVYNLTHTWEHYGNLVTYMRLKGRVPPTSAK